ncbi:hypothetical protein GW750_02450 [bacterium]|nr:hypothetical protein [bacterium]
MASKYLGEEFDIHT